MTDMTMDSPLKIALVQHACEPDPQKNLAVAMDMIRQAADRGAKLVFTQELFTSQYFPQREDHAAFDLAEPIPGPTSRALCELAGELGVSLVASLFEKRTEGVYHNTSIAIDPAGQLLGKYRKMHIPDDPCFYEKFYFTPGDLDWRTFSLGDVEVGTLICWDQWFPEAARLTAMHGARLLAYPTAIAAMDSETAEDAAAFHDAWRTIQRSHAIANGVFVAAINRVGKEGGLTFWGRSFVADPLGRIIAEANDTPQVVLAELDPALVEQTRRVWPFLRDRRIDAYSGLTQRWLDH